MNANQNPEEEHAGHARTWKHLRRAAFAWFLLTLMWIVLDVAVFRPEIHVETAMNKLRWIGLPLLAIALLFGGRWLVDLYQAQAREQQWKQKTEQLQRLAEASRSANAKREYVLEVISLGVTVEKYRQGALWDVLQTGTQYSSIREPDPKKYPWTAFDKYGVSGGRACDALENGAGSSPMYWGVPSFYAGAPATDPTKQPSAIRPESGLAASAVGTGMAWHLFTTAPWQLSERPDRILEQVFAFLDDHPDLPYIVLLSEDSMATRDIVLPQDAPRLVKDGHYVSQMPDSSAVFILARRERVEPLRPYVWDDPENDFVQDNLRDAYFTLHDSVPTPDKLAHPEKFNIGRQPTVDEWLVAAAAYARNPIVPGAEPSGLLGDLKRWAYRPPKDWKPTPWFPIPWNRDQMATFDRLPSLGFIHRPTFVKFTDKDGQAIKRRDQRLAILEAGWQDALQTLPEAERTKGPSRIIAATGKQVEQQLALEGLLHRYAAQGGPEIDTGKKAQFINTDHRLGNTGAATFFVQMALGVMGSYRNGGVTAAINMRDPNEASIIFISPPSEAKRKEQGSRGGNVFKSQVSPAIDPENYKAPAVETLIEEKSEKENASILLPSRLTGAKDESRTK